MSPLTGHLPRAFAAVLCALCLLAGGCGGSGYGDKVGSASKRFRSTTRAATQKMRSAGGDTRKFLDGLDEFQGSLDSYRRKLETLNPPRKARAAQTHVIAVVQTLSGDLAALRDALRAADIPALRRVSGDLQRDGHTVDLAVTELERAGG